MRRPSAPPSIASEDEYRRRLGQQSYWEPWIRAAISETGLPQPERLWMGRDLTYPTFVGDTDVVVKLFGDHFAGPESYRVEVDAYPLLEGTSLPVPALLGSGTLYPEAEGWKWPYLLLSRVAGEPYALLGASLSFEARLRLAREAGTFLRKLRRLPLAVEGPLRDDWHRFHALLRRRRLEAPEEYRRQGYLSPEAERQLSDFLPQDPTTLIPAEERPALVHGDLHAEHLFVDPTGGLTGVIDFTDAYAGDPRYDLLPLHFGTFRADKELLQACLEASGWTPPDASWAREMLALTILHDFDMLAGVTERLAPVRKAPDLETVARILWDPSFPGLPRREPSRGRKRKEPPSG